MAGTMGLQAAPSGYYTFGGGSAEVTRDKGGMITTHDAQGNLMAFTVWDAQVGGNQITDLLDYQGNPLPGTVSPIPDPASLDEGLILFYARNSFPAVFLDRGVPGSVRIALWAREMAALMPATIDKADTALTNSTSALADVDSANTNASNALSTANTTQAQQTQLMGVTPTIDELVFACRMSSLTETAVWVAPFACSLVWASSTWNAYNAAADNTNYLTLTLSKRASASPATLADIAAKTSQATGGEAITAMKSWTINGGAWSTANATFAAGDVLTARIDLAGTMATPGTPLIVGRYKPYRA